MRTWIAACSALALAGCAAATLPTGYVSSFALVPEMTRMVLVDHTGPIRVPSYTFTVPGSGAEVETRVFSAIDSRRMHVMPGGSVRSGTILARADQGHQPVSCNDGLGLYVCIVTWVVKHEARGDSSVVSVGAVQTTGANESPVDAGGYRDLTRTRFTMHHIPMSSRSQNWGTVTALAAAIHVSR